MNMDKIFDTIEVAALTKVPVLFVSNPGEGKTTAVELWAEANGYHYEVLIGSQYSQDEILGFQANNKGRLEILEPEWYRRIIEQDSNGIPSVLFLDEMSAAPMGVQGALLNLCSSREIRGSKKLPESTVVVSAANFKENLPDFCDILTPQINRFMVINLSSDNETALESYLSWTKPTYPENRTLFSKIKNNIMNNVQENIFNSTIKNELKSLFKRFESRVTSKGYLDMSSPSPAYLYGAMNGCVYNVITGRTLHYFARVLKKCIELNFSVGFMTECAKGLLGFGTGNWAEDEESRIGQINNFNKELEKTIININKIVSNIDSPTEEDEEKDDANKNLSELLFEDLKRASFSEKETKAIANSLKNLTDFISKNSLEAQSEHSSDFIRDYSTAFVWLKETQRKRSDSLVKAISKFVEENDILYEACLVLNDN